MRSRAFCTLFAPVSIDSNPKGIEPNRNFNGLVLELLIRFGLVPKVRTEPLRGVAELKQVMLKE
jgi:hypothetical protein